MTPDTTTRLPYWSVVVYAPLPVAWTAEIWLRWEVIVVCLPAAFVVVWTTAGAVVAVLMVEPAAFVVVMDSTALVGALVSKVEV